MGKERRGRNGTEAGPEFLEAASGFPREKGTVAAMRRARRQASGRDIAEPGATRRDFIKVLGATGASLGLPLVAKDAPAVDATPDAADSRGPKAAAGSTTVNTLFFNLSHIAPTTHYLYLARRRYLLGRVQDNPQVLAAARRT